MGQGIERDRPAQHCLQSSFSAIARISPRIFSLRIS
jgi:hypothetical protein